MFGLSGSKKKCKNAVAYSTATDENSDVFVTALSYRSKMK